MRDFIYKALEIKTIILVVMGALMLHLSELE